MSNNVPNLAAKIGVSWQFFFKNRKKNGRTDDFFIFVASC
jgi:hypothetical protein